MRSAHEIFTHFRALPESEQIATEFAIAGLQRWCGRLRPMRALELGTGLGTLTATLSEFPILSITTAEPNPQFRDRGDRLPRHAGILTMVSNVADANVFGPFDLIVIDLFALPATGAIARGAVIFFEGNLVGQQAQLAFQLMAAKRSFIRATWRPWDRSKGYSVIWCEPPAYARPWFAGVRLWQGTLDWIGRLCGVTPGWRRRTYDARY